MQPIRNAAVRPNKTYQRMASLAAGTVPGSAAPESGDADAVRLATAMAAQVQAAVEANDAEGIAARRAAKEFAEKEAELDALIAADSGSDDDSATVAGSRLERLLSDIMAREQGTKTLTKLDSRRLRDVLEDNGFESDANVPAWLSDLFRALWARTSAPVADYSLPTEGDGDVGELFVGLTQFEGLDCYDHGEWVRLRLARAGMLGFVSVQHNHYCVEKLAAVPDVGGSDLSDAKMFQRP